MLSVQRDQGRLSAGPVGESTGQLLALARADNVPIGVWHCAMIVERTSRRDLQHHITAVPAVVDGACRATFTSVCGWSDTALGWKASREYIYHEHPCEIYLDNNIGLYLCYIIPYLIHCGRFVFSPVNAIESVNYNKRQ